MTTYYKKILSFVLCIYSAAAHATPTPQQKILSLRFAPTMPMPFSDNEDDQYFAGLLTKIIQLDQEVSRQIKQVIVTHESKEQSPTITKEQLQNQKIVQSGGETYAESDEKTQVQSQDQNKVQTQKFSPTESQIHNLTLPKNQSITNFIAQDKKDSCYFLKSKDHSFGWNDPLAIISAVVYTGTPETPNELSIEIKKSTEFPGQYQATIQGKGLYSNSKKAHRQLTEYIKSGPTSMSKYARTEDIMTFDNFISQPALAEKKLLELTPSLQGDITCTCYAHGCDIQGVIYFDELVLAYLLQQQNSARYKNNTVTRVESGQIVSEKQKFNTLLKNEESKLVEKSIETKDTLQAMLNIHNQEEKKETDDMYNISLEEKKRIENALNAFKIKNK